MWKAQYPLVERAGFCAVCRRDKRDNLGATEHGPDTKLAWRTGEASGDKRTLKRLRLMSAIPPKADIGTLPLNVRCQKQTSLSELTRQTLPRMARLVPPPWGRAPYVVIFCGVSHPSSEMFA